MRRSLRPAHATDEEDALASLQSRETLETPIDEEAKQGRNTPEFNYALDSLPVEKFPTYVREFDNILTFPEKVRRQYCCPRMVLLNTVTHLPFSRLYR